ncbi:MAG: hypothetical protein RL108_410 [Bacteroidota bacterium]|jgi:hypothetical protein
MKHKITLFLVLIFSTSLLGSVEHQGYNCQTCKDTKLCKWCKGTKKCHYCKGKPFSVKLMDKDCPNCLNWNYEYRSKVPCHMCKDTRTIKVKGCLCVSLFKGTIAPKKNWGMCYECRGQGWCSSCVKKGAEGNIISRESINNVNKKEKVQYTVYSNYNGTSTESKNSIGFQWKKCNNEFPIKYGCSNDFTLELNTCIFGANSSSVFGPALLRALISRSQDMSRKEITKEMYDKEISLCKEHVDK